MNDIIFAVPRHEYTSYTDLYALIDLSGFQKVFIDEIDPQSDNAYVITILNGEIPAGGWAGAKAQIVVFDLEWRREPNAPIPGVKEFWMCDKWQAELCHAKYVPVGSHVGLKQAYNLSGYVGDHRDYAFDVAFIGYFDGVPRRQAIRQQLIAAGVRVSPPGAWGDQRNAVLNGSRAYLHVHQHADIPAVPGLRMVVAAAYKLPFITEACADAGIFYGTALYQWYVRQIEYRHMEEYVVHAVRNWESELAPRGEALHQLLCHDLTFRKSVEGAL